MKEYISAYQDIEREILQEKGPFSLFALFLRQDSPNRWDLLVAAPWLGNDKENDLRYLISKVKTKVGNVGLQMLSGVFIIDMNNPYLKSFYEEVQIVHGEVELHNVCYFNKDIDQAVIITSQSPHHQPTA